jgi:hypothetical protein
VERRGGRRRRRGPLKLPIPLHFSVDVAPYITAGQIAARDPATGVDTTGFHRLMLRGRNRLGVSLHSRRRMYEFHRRASSREIAAGGDHHRNASAALYGLDGLCHPPHVRKFEIIGGLFGEPYRVARCGVASSRSGRRRDRHRGEILAETRELRGCSASSRAMRPTAARSTSMPIACACARRDVPELTSGMSKDHILASCITREGEIQCCGAICQTCARCMSCTRPRCIRRHISMKKIADGIADRDHGHARHGILHQHVIVDDDGTSSTPTT